MSSPITPHVLPARISAHLNDADASKLNELRTTMMSHQKEPDEPKNDHNAAKVFNAFSDAPPAAAPEHLEQLAVHGEKPIPVEALTFKKHLGEGTFARVDLYELDGSWWKGSSSSSSKKSAAVRDGAIMVAVKSNKDNSQITWNANNTLAEAALLRTLNHGNIVRFIGYTMLPPETDPSTGMLRGTPRFALVQEYLAGGTLQTRIQLRDYTPVEAIGWLLDIARGMKYLHGICPDLCVAHRDLKPENVLITADGTAKIIDMGLFRIMRRQGSTCMPDHSEANKLGGRRTRLVRGSQCTGMVGTPRYMAPENWIANNYCNKVDVYSFAISALEVLAGERAYARLYLTAWQIPEAVMQQNLRPKIPSRWPDGLIALLTSCWHSDPQARPSFKVIVKQLDDFREAASTNRRLYLSLKMKRSPIEAFRMWKRSDRNHAAMWACG